MRLAHRQKALDELFDMWRAANPPADELARSVAAVKAALVDMEAGDNRCAHGLDAYDLKLAVVKSSPYAAADKLPQVPTVRYRRA